MTSPSTPLSTPSGETPRPFAIAFSFPGEHREYVEKVARALVPAFGDENSGKNRIFYDEWHEGKIIGFNSGLKLQEIYFHQCDLIVPFFCQDYLDKQWCGVELRAILALLQQRKYDQVLPFRFDRVEIPGTFETDVFPVVTHRPPADIARLILERHQEVIHKKPALRSANESPRTPGIIPDISRILKYAPEQLIGRESDLKLLNDAWDKTTSGAKPRPHILTFVALGGEGKTSLVAKWAAELAAKDWPGCDAAFAWSFYTQGTPEQQDASSDLFLKAALTFFGEEADKAFAATNAGPFEKGQRLARLVGQCHSLLILDGLEPLQYAPTSPNPGELKDQGIAALLKGLATASQGLCVVTTRYSLPDLKAFRQTAAPEVPLLRLSRAAGVHLLKTLGVKGGELRHLPANQGKELLNEFEKLVEDVKGHALTLNLLGTYLCDAHGGDIRKRDLVKLEEADAEIIVIPGHPHHAFHVMDAYVKWFETGGKNEEENKKGLRSLALLRLLGLFDRPATADCLKALWTGQSIPILTEPLIGLNEAQRNTALKRLEDAKLLIMNRAPSGELVSLDAHPHLRAYFARQLREHHPEAWRAGHQRLFEHLCTTTKEGAQPTLEALQPLYQAVAHGCQAGLQEEADENVYFARLCQGNEDYALKKLGAFASNLGAVACFFDTPWSQVSPALLPANQAFYLVQAAYILRAMGRLTESLEPMRAGLDARVSQENWKNAAVCASNLSELKLTLGDVSGAVGDAEQSVTYADRSGDADRPRLSRTAHADAQHQAGRRAESETCFREAEQMQKQSQPTYPLLYSHAGFLYCDLLLADAERAAWQFILNPSPVTHHQSLADSCRAVSQRAKETLNWEEGRLLDLALDRLTLGRAGLYAAILEHSDFRLLTPDLSQVDIAVAGLRRAGTVHHLPRALLTRAWLRFLTGARTGPDRAQADLDEAWEIAARGPMRLFLADLHLHRARLFFREPVYPWKQASNRNGEIVNHRTPKDDLYDAELLINACGYHRRDEELADAQRAILP